MIQVNTFISTYSAYVKMISKFYRNLFWPVSAFINQKADQFENWQNQICKFSQSQRNASEVVYCKKVFRG